MDTLRALPDIAGRRFGNISIGYDRVDQIRSEVATLETLAALICGCDRDVLTSAQIQRVIADLQSRMAALTAEDRAPYAGVDPQQLLAVAVSQLQT